MLEFARHIPKPAAPTKRAPASDASGSNKSDGRWSQRPAGAEYDDEDSEIPLPGLRGGGGGRGGGGEPSALELLEMRHRAERVDVDAIRREFGL